MVFCTNCGKRVVERAERGAVAYGEAPSALPQAPRPVGGTQVYAEARSSASAMACSRCGALSEAKMRFCRDCGAGLAEPAAAPSAAAAVEPTCPGCGLEREKGAAFCRHCGAAFRESAQPAFTPPLDAHPFAALSQSHSRSATPRLVTLLKDGSEGRSIALEARDADIGSCEGEVTLPDDPYISPRHARIACRDGTYSVRDLDSVNGVYVRLREEAELRDRDLLLVGQQVLRFDVLNDAERPLGPAFQQGVMVFGTPEAARFARLVQYTTEGVSRDVHYLFRDETVIGRENGDIVFTDDPFLSRRHAAIRVDHAGRRFTLQDLGSSNGTALRIRGEHVLRDGDQFRIGRHLFRFEAGAAGGRGAR